MTRRTVLVDLDNTIYDYDEAARLAKDRLVGWIATLTHTPPSIVEDAYAAIINETAETVFQSGNAMRRKRFQCLSDRLNFQIDVEELANLFGGWLLEEVRPYAGSLETLSQVSHYHPLMIVSEGYPDIQGSIARKLGIEGIDLFATFQWGTRKLDGSAYMWLMSSRRFDSASLVMIGDNWLKDVLAPAKCQISTIWISHGREMPGTPPALLIGSAERISDALPLLGIFP